MSQPAHIVRIGNSLGVRIPRKMLAESGIGDTVNMTVSPGCIELRAVPKRRTGWEAAFATMAAAGDDALLDGDQLSSSSFDETEWKW